MAEWQDGFWWSRDGVRLHYRDYAGGADGRPPILCIPGLTRNARDFASLADRLAGQWRVICVELRGRGDSGYAKDSMSYVPLTYFHDLEALIDELKLTRFVAIGTSLGGILTMLLASAGAERIAGAVLNDVGPELDPAGITRIRGYVGKSGSWPTWLHAARALQEGHRNAFPSYEIEDWIAMAKRLCKLTAAGRIVLDYDMRIADPFRMPGGEAGVDLWPAFEALKGRPLLLVHGELSDLLSRDTVKAMQARNPDMAVAVVPHVGHAPTLDEPAAAQAIDTLLARVA